MCLNHHLSCQVQSVLLPSNSLSVMPMESTAVKCAELSVEDASEIA